jgi:uncharacterized protein
MLDKKGIFSYLGITFGITYAIEIGMILAGVRFTEGTQIAAQYIVAAVMFVPAIATLITVKFITREGFGGTMLRFGKFKPYLVVWLLIPVAFALVYALTWALGITQPDFQMVYYMKLIASAGNATGPMPAPGLIYLVVFGVTLFPTPILNSVLGFGEELGWRGYLLPKLMPLGKVKAYSLMGLIWWLWHLPLLLIGFDYPGQNPLLGALMFMGLAMAVGTILNEMALRNRSSILAAWIHGVFNTQNLGMWAILFPSYNRALGGGVGLVGIVVWAAIAAGVVWVYARADRAKSQSAIEAIG